MIYPLIVWWHKVEQTATAAELQKRQRLACLLTVAIRSAAIQALEAMLDLHSLPALVRKEVTRTVSIQNACFIQTQYGRLWRSPKNLSTYQIACHRDMISELLSQNARMKNMFLPSIHLLYGGF
jgi:hypothetical protein